MSNAHLLYSASTIAHLFNLTERRAQLVSIDDITLVWSRFSGDMIVRFMLLPSYFQQQFDLTDEERQLIEAEFKTVLENLDQPFAHLINTKT
jgi:hypothetical protein